MKITHSSFPNDSFASYSAKHSIEKEIEKQNKTKTADTLDLSDQAKNLLEDAETVKDISEQLEIEGSATSSPYDELTKCLEIASRIIKGDQIPQADIMFLAEKQPELYSHAILMKQNNEHPKHHNSLLDGQENSPKGEDLGKVEIQEVLNQAIHSKKE